MSICGERSTRMREPPFKVSCSRTQQNTKTLARPFYLDTQPYKHIWQYCYNFQWKAYLFAGTLFCHIHQNTQVIKSFINLEFYFWNGSSLVLSVEHCTPYLATCRCFGKKFPVKWAHELLRSVSSNIRDRLLFPIRRIHQWGKVLLRRRRIQDRKVLIKSLDSSDYLA